MGATNLPGVTLDPKDEAGLETAFGVTSNAEELIKSNRARVSPELREASMKDENVDLSNSLHELDDDGNRISLKDDVSKAIGREVETANVRGSGARAAITYVYIGDRGSLEKGVIPYDEVFKGTASAKRRKAARDKDAKPDPDAAAQEAADKRIQEADDEAQAKITAAQEEAQQILDDAKAEAAEALAKAQQEAAEAREKAAEQAPKDADKAKQAAARKSGSGSK